MNELRSLIGNLWHNLSLKKLETDAMRVVKDYANEISSTDRKIPILPYKKIQLSVFWVFFNIN